MFGAEAFGLLLHRQHAVGLLVEVVKEIVAPERERPQPDDALAAPRLL